MVVRLLGTGAADGIPAFFDESRVSRYAREHGGKDVRTRSAALIDGQLKIDFGPDTFMQCIRDGINPRDWIAILFTHSDADHFSARELQYGLFPFTDDHTPSFAIYANEAVAQAIDFRYPEWPFEVHQTTSFSSFDLAEYRVTPIKANHSKDEDCHNLIIDDGTSRLLYATDTGVWIDETWEFLAKERPFDAIVIECTNGKKRSDYWGHLNVELCIQTIMRLRTMGVVKPEARVITTHHSHEGDMLHSELEDALRSAGAEPGFDGMEFVI